MEDTKLKEQVKQAVLQLLAEFKVDSYKEDSFFLNFSIDFVMQDIKNFCNIITIPEELFNVVVMRVLGLTLEQHIQTHGLESIDITNQIKSISEGDTSVTFSSSTDRGDLVKSYIASAKVFGLDTLYTFRRLRW